MSALKVMFIEPAMSICPSIGRSMSLATLERAPSAPMRYFARSCTPRRSGGPGPPPAVLAVTIRAGPGVWPSEREPAIAWPAGLAPLHVGHPWAAQEVCPPVMEDTSGNYMTRHARWKRREGTDLLHRYRPTGGNPMTAPTSDVATLTDTYGVRGPRLPRRREPRQVGRRATIRSAGIDTRNGQRGEHLRSNDFLAMDRYPEIT